MVINSSGDVSISLHANKLFGKLLEGEAITEIAINRPGEIFFEQKGYGIIKTLRILLMIYVILLLER